jgi:hypothetical protein
MMHTSGVTSSSGMLAVFSDTAMAGTYVTALLAVFLEAGCHFCCCV